MFKLIMLYIDYTNYKCIDYMYCELWIDYNKLKDKKKNCNPEPPLEVYGQPIKHVSNFRYLGSNDGFKHQWSTCN